MMVPFVKTQALGNDFLLVEEADAAADYATLAVKICQRNFGVGADGLIVWAFAEDHVRLRIFNRDGSEAECSGNGLRCLAAYLIESGRWPKTEIVLITPSGSYRLQQIAGGYTADMGVPGLTPDEIPFIPPVATDRVVDYPIAAAGSEFRISACSTGNPHCSLFVDEISDAFVERVGPALENHPAFPNRTNVEFIKVRNRREIDVAFWERGVGVTYASGTGSCGAAIASILNHKTDREVTVHTKAGKLQVQWGADGRIKLTATANVVADGNYREG